MFITPPSSPFTGHSMVKTLPYGRADRASSEVKEGLGSFGGPLDEVFIIHEGEQMLHMEGLQQSLAPSRIVVVSSDVSGACFFVNYLVINWLLINLLITRDLVTNRRFTGHRRATRDAGWYSCVRCNNKIICLYIFAVHRNRRHDTITPTGLPCNNIICLYIFAVHRNRRHDTITPTGLPCNNKIICLYIFCCS